MPDQIDDTKPYDLSLIKQASLTPIVRRALGSDSAVISDWNFDRVTGGAGDVDDIISHVFRFAGKALDRKIEKDWSLILKVVGTTATQDDPSHPRYWKREVSAYQSGKLAELPGNLTAPRLFGTYTFSEKVVGLWLEHVHDDYGQNWSIEHYGMVARHLGQFNGAFLAERELPSWAWLSQGWLRKQVDGDFPAFIIDRLRNSLDQSAVLRWFIEDDANRVLQLWEARDTFLDTLDRLPQTLLHHDAFRRNLFMRHKGDRHRQIVAVDWAFVGTGTIGEELVSLVNGTLFFSEVAMVNATKLDEIVFDSYLQGLTDAGWAGDPQLVRLGFTASSAMLWGLAYMWFDPPAEAILWLKQAYGLPIDELRVVKKELTHYVLGLAEEARKLMADL